jgi:hypothetical protein
VAGWKTRPDPGDAPAEAREYDPLLHGQGLEGIARWKQAALAWLAKGGSLPVRRRRDGRDLDRA